MNALTQTRAAALFCALLGEDGSSGMYFRETSPLPASGRMTAAHSTTAPIFQRQTKLWKTLPDSFVCPLCRQLTPQSALTIFQQMEE